MKLGVEVDVSKAQAFLRSTAKAHKRATATALNRTATTVRKEAANLIKEKRALPKRVITSALKIVNARVSELVAKIEASGKPIPMRHFATANADGVTALIVPGGRRVKLNMHGNSAFINSEYSPTVFVRATKKRLPIEVWPAVPGIPKVFAQEKVIEAMQRVAADVFPKRYKENLNYQLNIRPNQPKKPRAAK